MLVTIINDSSFCPDTKSAGWSSWVASNRGKKRFGAAFPKPVPSSLLAEMQGLISGLVRGFNEGLIQKGDKVLLQTDCMPGIHHLEGLTTPNDQDIIITITYFEGFVEAHNLEIEFRHVKAHTNALDTRSVVNRICDKEAKDYMRSKREEFKKAKRTKKDKLKARTSYHKIKKELESGLRPWLKQTIKNTGYKI